MGLYINELATLKVLTLQSLLQSLVQNFTKENPVMSFYTLWFLISVFLKFDLDFNLFKETYFNIYEEKRNFEIYTTFKPL